MPIHCEVMSVTALATNTYRILLKPEQAVSYKAGQYLLVVMGEKDKRPFSIASSPCRQNGHELELHIGAAEESPYALEVVQAAQATLQRGDASFVIEGPEGDAWLRDEHQRPVLLIAGGTGFSYIRSMLDHCLSQQINVPIFLYWGGRDPEQLYANEELEALAQQHSDITYVPVVQDISDRWQGRTGTVLDAVMTDFVSLSAYDIYIAGRFEMAGAAREMLTTERGASRANMFADAFAFL